MSDTESIDETYEYIYLLQPFNLIGTNIFKYGKTTNLHNRFDQYGQKTAIYHIVRVINCSSTEKKILAAFKIHFKKYNFGNEYFSGNYIEMIETIDQIIHLSNQKHENQENYSKFLLRFYKKKVVDRLDYRIPTEEPDNDSNDGDDEDDENDENDDDDEDGDYAEDIDAGDDDDDDIINDTINVKKSGIKLKKCPNCDKVFTRNESLKYHIDNNACKEYDFNCPYCDKGFTTEISMNRHIVSSCKIKKEEDAKKEDKWKVLLERMKKMEQYIEKEKKSYEKKIKLLNKKIEATSLVTKGNNNINNGTINNIMIVKHNKKDCDVDDNKIIKDADDSDSEKSEQCIKYNESNVKKTNKSKVVYKKK